MNKPFAASVLVAVVLITLSSALTAGYLVLVAGPQMPSLVSAFVERLSSVFTAGAGAIIALLGASRLSGGKRPGSGTDARAKKRDPGTKADVGPKPAPTEASPRNKPSLTRRRPRTPKPPPLL
jgi:hypothetical protein